MQPSTLPGAPPGPSTNLQTAAVAGSLARLRDLPGALLPVLHDVQEQLGFVPPAAVPTIAEALNLSVAEVHGVLSFYHDFRQAPPARTVLKVCRAEACQAVGSGELERHLRAGYGAGPGERSADGRLMVEPVYCLGNCALGPSVQLDGALHGRVDGARLDELLAAARVAKAGGCCGGGCS